MAEENIPGGGAIPPKQSPLTPIQPAGAPASGEAPRRPVIMRKPILRKPGDPASAPAVPPPSAAAPVMSAAPTAVQPPQVAAPVAQGIAVTREQAAKKMTARINLASATSQIQTPIVPPPSNEVKTIRLRPPAAPSNPEVSTPATPASDPTVASKSKTSRISLESAFNTQPELPKANPEAPKTIRLKRPTDMNGGPAKPVLKPPTTHVTIPPQPHQTASIPPLQPIDTPPSTQTVPPAAEPAPEASVTRKKTIKVKRPGAGGSESSGGPKITINKGGESDASEHPSFAGSDDNLQSLSAIDSFSPAKKPDKVNPLFLVAAIIGILVAINLIWIFAAQLYGPNAATADFAMRKGPDVPNPIGAMVVE